LKKKNTLFMRLFFMAVRALLSTNDRRKLRHYLLLGGEWDNSERFLFLVKSSKVQLFPGKTAKMSRPTKTINAQSWLWLASSVAA
jgi:hypothetical protein